jgi:chromatin assembly factor 1 subunit A
MTQTIAKNSQLQSWQTWLYSLKEGELVSGEKHFIIFISSLLACVLSSFFHSRTPLISSTTIISSSNLPLSSLVSKICSALNAFHKIDWSAESVSAKIKLLSKRRAYFEPTQKCDDTVDLFEHDCQDRLWRWEVTTLDLLNSDVASLARKARTARKKISSYQSALLKLVKSLDEIERQILDPALPNLDKSKAKISRDEERVLKFERDAEKQRLAEQSKARKLMEQAAKKKAREKAKEEAIEAKRRKKEELAEKKQEAAQAREEEKRKKEEEKLQKEQEKKKLEKKKLETAFRQKSTFRSFFAVPKKEENEPKTTSNTCTDGSHESFDVESFRSKVNASTDVVCFSMREQKRSDSAKASRRRRTEMVAVSVYKTVTADDADWGTPEYLEQTTIKVPNRYRFLSFHEDCRPAYRGTWMKKSSIVTGKNPFRKDTSVFDYDYDSEAEWEEGDDEMGEDVEDDAKNQEEEKDGEVNAKMYDFDDGFCVADDRLLDNEEDADDDTKALYKKKMLNREHEEHMHSNRIRIIAPGYGGLPLNLVESGSLNTDCVEGFDADDVADVLSSYKGIQLSDPKFCIDAFPQIRVNEEKSTEPSTNANANKDDYPAEAMIALARFSHHSTHNSKDKLIEELRTLHPTLFSIRAKATRKLDAIAVKRKHPKYSAVYWEVKTEVLTELGLTDIMVCLSSYFHSYLVCPVESFYF